MQGLAVTEEDRRNFQKWLKKAGSRYRATHGRRDRPGGKRRDHGPITTGAGEIGNEIRKDVPKALAALVVHGGAEDAPVEYLRPWVGSNDDVLGFTLGLLRRDRDSLANLVVYGLWCEHDGCHRFIRPVAVKPSSEPGSFFRSAVCATCQDVTVIWADGGGIWVRSAPELKHQEHRITGKRQPRYHPMEAGDLWRWVQRAQPHTNREARLIAP